MKGFQFQLFGDESNVSGLGAHIHANTSQLHTNLTDGLDLAQEDMPTRKAQRLCS